MKEDDFWGLVELAKTSLDAYQQRLKALSGETLVDLYWTFEEAAAELRGDRHVPCYPKGMSDDAMLDFSLWVVSQGRSVYEEVLKHPAQMRSLKGGTMNYVADVVREYKARFKTYVPLRPE